MSLIDYTTPSDIRALLGVSEDEISDATLSLEVYDAYLASELEDIGADLAATYSTVAVVPEAARTSAQKKFYRLTRLFSSYAAAKQLTTSLPMFGPKDISDGKATVSRFADSPYRDVVKRITQEYDRLKSLLAEAFAGLTSSTGTSTQRVYLGSTGLATDPVTNS